MTSKDKWGNSIVVGELAIGQVPGGGQVTGRVLALDGDQAQIQDEGAGDDTLAYWCPLHAVEMQSATS